MIKHCSPTYAPSQSSVSLFGVPLYYFKNAPNAIIQPQVHPGDCWAFEGSKGHACSHKASDKGVLSGARAQAGIDSMIAPWAKELLLNQSRPTL